MIEILLKIVGLEPIPEGYWLLAEELVPRNRAISYNGYAIRRALNLPENAVHYYVNSFNDSWSITLTPVQWQTPPGPPEWAIDSTYLFRWRALRHVARSLWTIDRLHSGGDS